jgi:hypothetical protein
VEEVILAFSYTHECGGEGGGGGEPGMCPTWIFVKN